MAPKRNGLCLNDLPDSLLTFILSKVPLKQAVRCSVLSKRWKFLWTFLPNLKFSEDFFSSSGSPVAFQNIIDSIFELHSGSLELFELNNTRSWFTSEKICEWIQRAALKDVREMSITESAFRVSKVEVPTSIFLCHKVRSLALKNFLLTNIPDCFSGFAGLATLNFQNVKINDKTIELMLQLCPVLENLIVRKCDGLQRLEICSDILISLDLSSTIKAITLNCPRLVSLVIESFFDIDEMEFYLPACLRLCTDRVAELEAFRALKSLRKITLLNGIFSGDLKILSDFPDLEQMCIDITDYSALRFFLWCNDAMQEISGVTFALENLKQVHLNLSSLHDPMPLVAHLLRHAPAMKTLFVSRKSGFGSTKALRFVNRLLNHPRPSTETKILLSQRTLKEVRCLHCDIEKSI